jgi:hypothetical protein
VSTSEIDNFRHPYIPQRLAVKSMRDNGYKNTAYALAELIDNSYQAIERVQELDDTQVGEIEVIVVEEWEKRSERTRRRPTRIAVVDNGCGMDSEELRMALQFGNGTHLDDRKGIGRFGMGLPNATISQCRRASVWTWQAGSHKALMSYLDLDEIELDLVQDVHVPVPDPVPHEWLEHAPMIRRAHSGTLVVWSNLDRLKWRTAKSTLENTEELIGRIYRKLISRGLVLRLTIVCEGERTERYVRINDPLYLTAPSCTPAPFDKMPMFQPYGRDGREVFLVNLNGSVHEVVVTLSYAKDEARILDDGSDAGNRPYGKHARENVGVSIVRADRELILDTAWSNNDLRERWWGAEISFPPDLDEVFGVTNNKQFATHFTEMASYYRDDRNDDEWQEVRNGWEEEGAPQYLLIEVCNYLQQQLNKLRTLLRAQTKGSRSKKQKRHDAEVETKATQAFNERAEADHSAGEADDDVAPATKRTSVEVDLVRNKKYAEVSARELAEYVVDRNLRVLFVENDNPEADSFFSVDVLPGVTEIVFNTAHPAFGMLISVLDPSTESETAEQLRGRITNASDTLRLLLAAWARYEAEEKAGPRQDRLRAVRQEWGRMAKSFLKNMDQSSAYESTVSD